MDLLVIVGVRRHARRLQQLLELVPEDGYALGILRVGTRGEESDETVLAHQPTRRVQLLDHDVVHAGTPMYGGLGSGLADDQNRATLEGRTQARVHLRQRQSPGVAGHCLVPQDAKPRAPLDHDFAPAPALDQVVAAVAEEDEGTVTQPAQEVLHLRELGPSLRQCARTLGEPGHHAIGGLEHGVEVAGCPQHVLEPARHLLPDVCPVGCIRDLCDLAVDQALPRFARASHADFADSALSVPAQIGSRIDEVLDREVLRVEVL